MSNTNDTKTLLAAFTEKAAQRLRDKKVSKTKTLYIPSMDVNITVKNLTGEEISEILDIENTTEATRYCCYIGCLEPNLRTTAKKLKESGDISQYTDVVDIFDFHEINEISEEIMKLTGITANKSMKVKVVEDLKN